MTIEELEEKIEYNIKHESWFHKLKHFFTRLHFRYYDWKYNQRFNPFVSPTQCWQRATRGYA
ncbi:MAG: hypothetical protein AABY22_15235, partial [Nanoarchaeota archaeon]